MQCLGKRETQQDPRRRPTDPSCTAVCCAASSAACCWPADGYTDRHLRELAEIASKHLGQNIVVENKPGGGTFGPSQRARSAKPDVYAESQFPLDMHAPPAHAEVVVEPAD